MVVGSPPTAGHHTASAHHAANDLGNRHFLPTHLEGWCRTRLPTPGRNGAADAVKALGDAGADVAAKERELAEAVRTHGRASTEAQTASNALEAARRRQLGDIDALAQAPR